MGDPSKKIVFSFDDSCYKTIYFTNQDAILVYIEPHEMIGVKTKHELNEQLKKKIEDMYQDRCTKDGYVVKRNKKMDDDAQDKCKIHIVTRNAGYAPGDLNDLFKKASSKKNYFTPNELCSTGSSWG